MIEERQVTRYCVTLAGIPHEYRTFEEADREVKRYNLSSFIQDTDVGDHIKNYSWDIALFVDRHWTRFKAIMDANNRPVEVRPEVVTEDRKVDI